MNDPRTQLRFTVDNPVKISFLGSNEERPGKLANISGTGLMVNLEHPIVVGDAVQIDAGDDLMVGVVRHCRKFSQGYIMGMRISNWASKGSLQAVVRSFHTEIPQEEFSVVTV